VKCNDKLDISGLVGGSVPVFDEIIVSTSLMDNILSLDEWTGTKNMNIVIQNYNSFLEIIFMYTS